MCALHCLFGTGLAELFLGKTRHDDRQLMRRKRIGVVQNRRYWQVLAAAKWATIAVLQGDRYRIGGENSLELALTGLMVSELELEALDGVKVCEDLAKKL